MHPSSSAERFRAPAAPAHLHVCNLIQHVAVVLGVQLGILLAVWDERNHVIHEVAIPAGCADKHSAASGNAAGRVLCPETQAKPVAPR
jgi:hypothetical protein